jgi:hypothetical protein
MAFFVSFAAAGPNMAHPGRSPKFALPECFSKLLSPILSAMLPTEKLTK